MNQKSLKALVIGMNHFLLTLSMGVEDNDSALNLGDCLVEVVHAVGQRKVALEYASDYQGLVSEILRKIAVPVVLNVPETRKTGIELRTFVDLVLLFRNVEPKEVLDSTLWNAETRFVMVGREGREAERYFEGFWALKVVNVFAVAPGEGEVVVRSFLPHKENCSGVEVVVVDSCAAGELRDEGRGLREPMRLRDLKGCTVNITVTDVKPSVIFEAEGGGSVTSSVKGFEGNLIAEVARILNFRTRFKLPDDGIGWGWIRPSPHGTVSEVFLGISDIAIGMLGALPDRYENLDVSTSYNMDECLTFAVPRGYGAQKSPWMRNFLLEFSISTWLLIGFSFLLTAVAGWLVKSYLNVSWFSSKTEAIILLYSSCLGVPIRSPDYAPIRILVAFWVTCTFILAVAYKGSMGSKLTVPPRDPEICTLEELLQSDLRLTGYKNMYQVMASVDSWVYRNLIKRYQFENFSVESAVERIADREKLAHIRHASTFYYYSMINPKARGRIHVIRDCVLTYRPLAMTKKHSPFTARISQTVSRLEEAGIMPMWRAEYIKRIPPQAKPFFRLTVEQMVAIFYFLFLGYAAAFFCLLVEFFYFWWLMKHRN